MTGKPAGIVLPGVVRRLWLAGLIAISLLAIMSPAMALERQDVWLSSDDNTPDMLDLFRQPERWTRARERVGTFKFAPHHVTPGIAGIRNSYTALKDADAFAALQKWGIKIATEEGAVKEWDCTGTAHAPQATANHIANIAAANAMLQVVAMDEPLVSGRGPCALPVEEIAKRTAAYVAAVKSSKEAQAAGEGPEFGDIEPYPSIPVPTLIEWVKALETHGFKPAFLHLDINVHYLDVHPEVPLADDLRTLARFFHDAGIPFGVIFWSGYDPLNSDRAYYDHVMDLAGRVKAAIGPPDQAVFQSWVTRSPVACSRSEPHCAKHPCSPADPPYCGEKSIPLNLPDDDPAAFTQTRLVRDVLALFGRR
jgi:hypothetical protein